MTNAHDVANDYLQQLDLSYIARKMCSRHYPMPRRQPALADTCLMLYKRFLWYLIKYPEATLVPTMGLDEVWHNHILYTQNYTQDLIFFSLIGFAPKMRPRLISCKTWRRSRRLIKSI